MAAFESRIVWWRKEVGLRQLSLYLVTLEAALARRRLEVSSRVAGPEDFEEIRLLQIQHSAVKAQERGLKQRPATKRRLWGRLLVRLYEWSIRGRSPGEIVAEKPDPHGDFQGPSGDPLSAGLK